MKTPGSGRKKGTPNKLTATVKDEFETAFRLMQEEAEVNLFQWGKNNPTEFYRLASKMIPADMNAKITGAVKVDARIEFV